MLSPIWSLTRIVKSSAYDLEQLKGHWNLCDIRMTFLILKLNIDRVIFIFYCLEEKNESLIYLLSICKYYEWLVVIFVRRVRKVWFNVKDDWHFWQLFHHMCILWVLFLVVCVTFSDVRSFYSYVVFLHIGETHRGYIERGHHVSLTAHKNLSHILLQIFTPYPGTEQC